MPRHAKAGNLNNALFATEGEFLLILDADQIPEPTILDRTLGYFRDPQVALVQTPQFFTNVTDSDPLGSQAPLFYGPIQQGKDGWNAAFFCGSNAVLRREALMQLGIVGLRQATWSARSETVLKTADSVLAKARSEAKGQDPAVLAVARRGGRRRARRPPGHAQAGAAHVDRRGHLPVPPAGGRGVAAARRRRRRAPGRSRRPRAALRPPRRARRCRCSTTTALNRLAQQGHVTAARARVGARARRRGGRRPRSDEAQPIMPMATLSVTEDMATAMRLHSMGWKSAYHHEILAHGLAPEDLGTMLQQRLRWAQGTLQVMLKENPLVQKGLSVGQRLMYFATMWSYLSGFFALVYIAAPIFFLCFGVRPVISLRPGLPRPARAVPGRQPAPVPGDRLRQADVARHAVQPGAVPAVDPRDLDGGRERRVPPAARLRRHSRRRSRSRRGRRGG